MSDQSSRADTLERASQALSGAARGLLQRDLTPLAFVERLLEKQHHEDALIFTAHVLPARDAVWWGCVCAWKKVRPEPSEKEAEAFRAALRWIQKPNEETRRAASAASELATTDTPAGCIALAVFFTDGSISDPGLPVVAPASRMVSTTILGALRLAAALEQPTDFSDCFRRYVVMARDPLRRLSSAVAPKAERAEFEGSIASRWSEEPPDSGPGTVKAATPAAASPSPSPPPPQRASTPRPEPKPRPSPPQKAPKPMTGDGNDTDKDAWEGLSKLEDD